MNRVALLSIFLFGCGVDNDPEDYDAHDCEVVEGYADDVDDVLGDHLITCHHRGCAARPGGGSPMN